MPMDRVSIDTIKQSSNSKKQAIYNPNSFHHAELRLVSAESVVLIIK